jgi:energy-coupling factor transport system ATP-binding protein
VVILSVASVELWNVVVRLGGRDVLKGVTASFEPGVHVVLGRNGAGKTTLLRAIAGLVKFDGEVRVLGRSIRELSRKELSKLVAYCWQNPYYGFIEATVEDEVRAILRILGVEGDWRVAELLVPKELMGRDPATLSGGEAKRVSMASMLVADQPVWLLDEPFTYLDREGVEAVVKLIEYARKKGKIVIVTLHEVFYASLVKPDTFIALDSGAVVASGRWSELSDKTLNSIGLVSRGALCATLCS